MKIKGTKQSDIYLAGQDGNDVIYGHQGDDRLFGMTGNDALFGGSGADVLFGETGTNAMRGGRGRDTFVIDSFESMDAILDFQPGKDRIILRDPGVWGVEPLPADDFGSSVTYDGAIIYFHDQPVVVVGSGLHLTAADFYLA